MNFKNQDSPINLLGEKIALGESKKLDFNFTNLFTDTKVEIPVIVERSKYPGPTVLITSGIHGDEVNGIEIVRQLISKKINVPQCGTIICIPIINVFGFINKSRYFPDGRDLNREFPGTNSGSLASRFAFHFVNEILPLADYCMDFHTGGDKRFNAAQIRIETKNTEAKKLADIFNAPFTMFEPLISGSYRETCSKNNIPYLINESGKTLSLDKTMAREAVDGVIRVLSHLEMLNTNITVNEAHHKNIVIEENTWIRASRSGFLHIKIPIQKWVTKGENIGSISAPYGSKRLSIKAPNEGYIININHAPMVYEGDAIFHITTKTIH